MGRAVARAGLYRRARLDDTWPETAGGSGVMAVMPCRIPLGRAQRRGLSVRTRLESRAAWDLIALVLTSLLFILIGLSRGDVLERLAGRGAAKLAEAALTKLSWELDFEENRGRRALG